MLLIIGEDVSRLICTMKKLFAAFEATRIQCPHYRYQAKSPPPTAADARGTLDYKSVKQLVIREA